MDYGYPKPECSLDSFLDSVRNHELSILKDDGLYKHLKFGSPVNYWDQWFEVVTYPNTLIFSGDMGTYVFSRTEDMFTFFRKDGLEINPDYWSRKCLAVDKHDGIKSFSPAYFIAKVKEWMDEAEFSDIARGEIEEELISSVYSAEYRAAIDFEASDGTTFDGFWEVDCDTYTYRFLWCCYAVVWAIQKYDNAKLILKDIENILADNIVNDGYKHPLEDVLNNYLSNFPETKEAMRIVLSRGYEKQHLISEFIQIIGRLDAKYFVGWAEDLLAFWLTYANLPIRDSVVTTLYNWKSDKAVSILRNHKEEVQWLDDYLQRLLKDNDD